MSLTEKACILLAVGWAIGMLTGAWAALTLSPAVCP